MDESVRLADLGFGIWIFREAAWCIFDNTTLGAATRNAPDLSTKLGRVCRI